MATTTATAAAVPDKEAAKKQPEVSLEDEDVFEEFKNTGEGG